MANFTSKGSSAIYAYLEQSAIEHGENNVRQACKQFLKKKTITGIDPTIRKAVPRAWTEEAYLKQSGICPRCKDEMKLSEAEGDHIKPLVLGGEHHKRNIQALHKKCNASKGGNDFKTESKLTGRTTLQQLTQQ